MVQLGSSLASKSDLNHENLLQSLTWKWKSASPDFWGPTQALNVDASLMCDGCGEIDPSWPSLTSREHSLLISPSFIHEQQQLIGWPELFCWYRWFPRSPFYSVTSKLLSFLAFGSSLAFWPRLVFTEQLPAPQSGLFYQNSGLESVNWSRLCRVATWF